MGKVTVAGRVAAMVAVLGWSHAGGAVAADAVPFFKPDRRPVMYGPPLPDPDVPSCAANDQECLQKHDGAALSAALADKDVVRCDESRTPASCRATYEMITGTVGMKADPILDDPCSWVVLVDHGIALIESKRKGTSHRYADRGWKPRTFLGKCDLSKLPSRANEATVPLPAWVARPPVATGTQASAPKAKATSPDPFSATPVTEKAASAAPEVTRPAPSSSPGPFVPVSTKEP